jgi:alpha-1,3-glucan synthase
VDLYHINDYHGALAPVHLLPDTIPCCLSLHNAEFQGLWPMRTPKECKEVCEVFNVSPHVARKYVQYGEVFNLLHAGASYLRIHQRGFGAVGVSAKYGKRSLARYPIFWGLAKIGKLPNPDPSDTGDYSGAISKDEDVPVDQEYENGRGELRRQAQEWAGLEQNPSADLLVFVGRWSMQKGVDLIADIMPAILEENDNVQLICIGPVIDLYGKFAALKLDKLMKLYPKRVFSKPEFTALPPYIFSGAEFALIPSRDEPFGLVAVEFGRKGALGIGARVGGLGQMPGWWYTVESTSTTHLIHQFKTACKEALSSKPEVRAKMRARSAKQRFPVVRWVEDLETLQSTAIKIHQKVNTGALDPSRPSTPRGFAPSGFLTPGNGSSGAGTPSGTLTPIRPPPPEPGLGLISRPGSPTEDDARDSTYDPYLAFRAGPYQSHLDPAELQQTTAMEQRIGFAVTDTDDREDPYGPGSVVDDYTMNRLEGGPDAFNPQVDTPPLATPLHGQSTPVGDDELLQPPKRMFSRNNLSTLSLDSVVGTRKDFLLQKVDPFFTDSTGEFFQAFEKKLEALDGKTSEDQLCIEDYLVKSEKKWFDRFRDAKLGRTPASTPAPSVHKMKRDISGPRPMHVAEEAPSPESYDHRPISGQFLLDEDYVPPKGLQKLLQLRIGDWPLYSLFLSFVSCFSSRLCFFCFMLIIC